MATLQATEEIKQLKARYFRFLDTRDWESLVTVWAPEVELDMTQAGGRVSKGLTPAGALAYMQSRIGATTSMVHHGHQPEISLTSEGTATGIWAFEDWLDWEGDAKSPDGYTHVHGCGHYHDRYILTSDGWRICYTAVTRLRSERR